MGLREDKFWAQAFSAFCTSIPPAVANLLLSIFWDDISKSKVPIVVFIIVLIETFSVILAYATFYKLLPLIPFLRAFHKYEGRWLEIIPNPPSGRKYSIIDFKFNYKTLKYELKGVNFHKGFKTGVDFQAYRFIERTFKNGFYYITNPTTEHKNGLGKISFVELEIDNLLRAEGYFFDSDSGRCSRKYDTWLIKFDKKFFEKIRDEYMKKDDKNKYKSHKQFSKECPQKLMGYCKKFAEEQVQDYNNQKQQELRQAQIKKASGSKCKYCPKNIPTI